MGWRQRLAVGILEALESMVDRDLTWFDRMAVEKDSRWEKRTWPELKRLADEVPEAGIHLQSQCCPICCGMHVLTIGRGSGVPPSKG